MKLRRHVFSLITIVLLFPSFLFSQSSIYQDAKELAGYLEEDWSIFVELNKIDSSKATLTVKNGDNQLSPIRRNKYQISNYGYFSIAAESYSNFDTIIISNKDSIISKEGPFQDIGIRISAEGIGFIYTDKIDPSFFDITDIPEDVITYSPAPIDTLIQTYHEYNDPSTGQLLIDTIFTSIVDTVYQPIFTTFSESFAMSSLDASMPIPKQKKEMEDARQILYNLAAHADFKNIDEFQELNFQKIQHQYLDNPFLNNLKITSPLLSPNVDESFPSDFFGKLNSDFSNQYYNDYPWHKLLYGDSILQFQKNVSFKDASASYRKRIVTSQNELQDVSVRINNANKSKNLLDAKTVAVGLSDFIAERAQEELNLTFFNRFKENLEEPSELTVLFPNTKNLLNQFEISNYKTLLSYARESFKVDLENLGLNFPEILKLKKYKNFYNSPDVFNLSLIYSIADLAYKEEPVENILIAGFQKLNERKQELKKSINIELADNFIATVIPTGINKKSISSKHIQNIEELDKLEKYVKEYLVALENSQNAIIQNNDFLNALDVSKISTMLSYYEREEYQQLRNNINKNLNPIRDNFIRPIQYNNRFIKENSLLNFYQKTISANLRGKNFYGYLMNDPLPDDYQLFFKPQPDSINSIIALGIEGSRNLLKENFEKILAPNFQLLKDNSKINRKITQNYIIRLEKKNDYDNEILSIGEQAKLLKSAIENEIDFWEKTIQQDQTDYHIAGLYFLKASLEKSIEIQLFVDVSDILKKGKSLDRLRNDFYPTALGKAYNKNMRLANIQINSIQADFEDKIKTLTQNFGNITVTDSIYQRHQLSTQLHLDTLALYEILKEDLKVFEPKKSYLKHYISNPKIKHNIQNLKLDSALKEKAKEIKNQKLRIDQLGLVLNVLNQNLRIAENQEERKKLNFQIDNINSERDSLEEKLETSFEKGINKIKSEENTVLQQMSNKKQFLINNFQSTINTHISTQLPLNQIYSLDENPYYIKYDSVKNSVNEINFNDYVEMEEINQLDLQLSDTENTLNVLMNKRNQLENYFTYLDTTYCKNLVKAQHNATNLAKSLEVSTHLLFAFRDYERIYDPVYVYDSSYIKITVNQLDSLTGFTNTLTRDSLQIKRDTIEGTTEPLIAARWITRKEFDDLRKDELQWNIFLGLIYQRLKGIENAPNFAPEGVALLTTKFLNITHDIETHRSNLRRKKAITPDLVTFKDYYPFIRSTVDLFNTVITTPSIGTNTETISNKFDLQNIPQISNEALSLYENIYVQEYGNAVLNAMELLKIISSKKLNKKEARKSQRSINAVLTYGTFMANMINAQSSSQVKNILKSATLPPGSSRIKRETVTSFTINSYLGVAAGRDRLLNVPDNLDLAQDAFGASLSVPIGFTYSFSPKFIKNNSSFSLHVPLLDLGAITAYRQNPDNPNYSIDDLPDFSWNNLFSPGAFVVYNFSNSPFSLGVGGQYGPQLREITPIGGEAVNVNSWRFPMAFFTIDVPFFNLHTGARKIIVD